MQRVRVLASCTLPLFVSCTAGETWSKLSVHVYTGMMRTTIGGGPTHLALWCIVCLGRRKHCATLVVFLELMACDHQADQHHWCLDAMAEHRAPNVCLARQVLADGLECMSFRLPSFALSCV